MRVFVCAFVASACLLLVVPTQGRYVKGERYTVEAEETQPEDVGKEGAQGIEQGVTDRPHDDPDWVPQPDDYVVDDNRYDYDGDYGDEDYGDDDYYYDGDDENKLWLSDDDPDWTPDDKTRYDLLVQHIAQFIVHSPYNQQPARSQQEIEQILRDENPSLEELTLMLAMLVKQTRYGYDSREDTSREYLSQEDRNNEHLSLEYNSQENELFSQEWDGDQYHNKGKRSLAKKVKREAYRGALDQDQRQPSFAGWVERGWDRVTNAIDNLRHSSEESSEEWDQADYYYRTRQNSASKVKRQDYYSKGGQNQYQDQNQNQNQDQNQNQYQNQDQNQNQDQGQNQYWNEYRGPGEVAEGVEPLVPAGGPQRTDVGEGVEPIGEGEEDHERPSFTGWLERGWNRVTGAVNTLGEKAEETFDKWGDVARDKLDELGDKLSNVGEGIQHAAAHVVDKVQDAAESASEGVQRIKYYLVTAFAKFGSLVQEGAKYCIFRLTHIADQVRGSDILDKLEHKMSEGNAQVAEFFQMLGQKIEAWKASHPVDNVDEGLVTVQEGQEVDQQGGQGVDQQGGQGVVEGWNPDQATGEVIILQEMPNFFQDEEVVQQLHKLQDTGVLNQEDFQFLTQQQSQQQGQY